MQTFLLCNWIFAIKKSILANLQIFFADSKSRAQDLSNDVPFVIFGLQTWDLEARIFWFSSTPAEIGLNKPKLSKSE